MRRSNVNKDCSWRVLFVLLLAISHVTFASETDDKQKLNQVREEITSLSTNLEETQHAYSESESLLVEADRKIGVIARSIRELNQNLSSFQQKISSLEKGKLEEQQKLAVQQIQLSAQIRSAYAMGRQDKIKLILNQQDPAVLERMMAYYDYLARARVEQMSVIKRSIDKVNTLQLSIEEESLKAKAVLAKRLDEQKSLELAKQQRQQLLLTLKESWANTDKKLKILKSSEKQLLKIISKIGNEEIVPKAMEKTFAKMKGRLPWPSKGRLAISFGSNKVGGLRWDGVLIAAEEGKDVKAIHRGRVAYADWLRGYGLLIILEHSNGYMTLYGHNESLLKDAGEWVEAGEVIASVGRSGGNAFAGVYFGIRKKGAPRNPKKWCKRIRGKKIT
jgi:septal ring factor EnvC (AmiA/AmiB activator)